MLEFRRKAIIQINAVFPDSNVCWANVGSTYNVSQPRFVSGWLFTIKMIMKISSTKWQTFRIGPNLFTCSILKLYIKNPFFISKCRAISPGINDSCDTRADSRLAPSQWETSLQSSNVSHWLGASLDSALWYSRNACLPGSEYIIMSSNVLQPDLLMDR